MISKTLKSRAILIFIGRMTQVDGITVDFNFSSILKCATWKYGSVSSKIDYNMSTCFWVIQWPFFRICSWLMQTKKRSVRIAQKEKINFFNVLVVFCYEVTQIALLNHRSYLNLLLYKQPSAMEFPVVQVVSSNGISSLSPPSTIPVIG